VHCLVIIPTYNEKENIVAIAQEVLSQSFKFHLLVVDDGSPDGTADLVKSLQKDHPERVFLIERKGKLGLGTAYIKGFHWGLARDYAYFIEMDADFSHNPKDLNRLLQPCEEGDVHLSIGSRYVKGGKVINWPKNRIALSYGASMYVRILTGMRIKDPTSGFVCYRREVLESIDLNSIKFIGYAFQIEMKYAAMNLGFRLAEIPIAFTDRVLGESKITKNIVWEGVFGVITMRFSKLANKYKSIKRLGRKK
jgi:dolichol-phosphate mannosyltransferase